MSTPAPHDSLQKLAPDAPRVWRFGGQRNDAALDEHYLYETFEGLGISLPIPLVIRRERYEQPLAIPHGLHLHRDFYALYIVAGGSGTHIVNGHPFAMVRGDVYLLAPGAVHDYRNYHFIEMDALYFAPGVLTSSQRKALSARGEIGALFSQTLKGDTKGELMQRRHLSPARHEEVLQSVFTMRRELDAATSLDLEMVKAALFRLLGELAQSDAQSTPAPRPDSKSGLERVLAFCQERFHEPLSIAQLASLMHLTPGHFSEVFAREMGMPPTVYLRQVRLESAQTLLETTRHSVGEIAKLSGFGAPAHFSRAFRAAFGCTPTQYRSNHDLFRAHPATDETSDSQPAP